MRAAFGLPIGSSPRSGAWSANVAAGRQAQRSLQSCLATLPKVEDRLPGAASLVAGDVLEWTPSGVDQAVDEAGSLLRRRADQTASVSVIEKG